MEAEYLQKNKEAAAAQEALSKLEEKLNELGQKRAKEEQERSDLVAEYSAKYAGKFAIDHIFVADFMNRADEDLDDESLETRDYIGKLRFQRNELAAVFEKIEQVKDLEELPPLMAEAQAIMCLLDGEFEFDNDSVGDDKEEEEGDSLSAAENLADEDEIIVDL